MGGSRGPCHGLSRPRTEEQTHGRSREEGDHAKRCRVRQPLQNTLHRPNCRTRAEGFERCRRGAVWGAMPCSSLLHTAPFRQVSTVRTQRVPGGPLPPDLAESTLATSRLAGIRPCHGRMATRSRQRSTPRADDAAGTAQPLQRPPRGSMAGIPVVRSAAESICRWDTDDREPEKRASAVLVTERQPAVDVPRGVDHAAGSGGSPP